MRMLQRVELWCWSMPDPSRVPPMRKHKTQNKFRWTPRHNYSKSLLQQTFCSTHEHEPTKKDGSLSVFKYMLLLALLAVVLSSCGTSEPSYTKQSFMNAKEHSNTETLFQRNAEAFSYGNSIPKLILRRSKPSFQPSIPNIHLTSKHQPETGAVHCSPLRSSLLTIGRTPSETLFSSLRGAMHHTRCYQIVDVHATNHQATKVHLTGKHGTW